MKFNNPSRLLFSCLLIIAVLFSANAQSSYEKSRSQAGNIVDVFNTMFSLANTKYKNPNMNTCDAHAYIKKLPEYLLSIENIETVNFTELFDRNGNSDWKFKENFNKGLFKTLNDKLLFSSSSSKDFTSFVSKFTEKDIEGINKKDLEDLRFLYDSLKRKYKTGRVFNLINPSAFPVKNSERIGNCELSKQSTITILSYSYPKLKLALKTKVSLSCTCESNMKSSDIKKALYEYSASVSATSTAEEFEIDKNSVKDAQLIIGGISCCPEKKEDDKSATAPPETEKKKETSFIDDTLKMLQEAEDAGTLPREKKTVDDDAPGSWYRQAIDPKFFISAHAGLPLGREADFYSLNFGLDANYLFRISEDFGAGLSVGYTQFLGKDVNGFKTEGIGFIPVQAKAEYSLSEVIAAYGNLGYGIATGQGSGGISIGVGAKYKVAKNIEVGPAFRSIIVEGGSFSTIILGVDIGL